MMKPLRSLPLATLGLLLLGCGDDATTTPQPDVRAPLAVSFDTQVAPAATRSTDAYTVDETLLRSRGFGVFAYYTNTASYTSGASAPNFMFNQCVTHNGTDWQYSPLKYWPNDISASDVDQHGATGSQADGGKVSFFAYGPCYASGEDCITEPTDNTTAADPRIAYQAATYPAWGTDLVWGVAPASMVGYTDVAGNTITVTEGMPLLNLKRPATTQRVEFNFLHALARLGVVVRTDEDVARTSGTTKVLIESVSISCPQLIARGALNLNNTTASTPQWEDTGSAADLSGTLNEDLRYTAITPPGVPNSGQDDNGITARRRTAGKTVAQQFADLPTGVTAMPQQLWQPVGGNDYFHTAIPVPAAGNTANVTVDITYHVITLDANLPYGYSDVANTASKTVILSNFKAGTIYTLLLRLGLTSIKAEATSTAWPASSSTETTPIP